MDELVQQSSTSTLQSKGRLFGSKGLVLLGMILVFSLGIAFGYMLHGETKQSTKVATVSEITPTVLLSPTSIPMPSVTLSNTITYKLPSGWKSFDKYDANNGGTREHFVSSDYKDDGMRPTILNGGTLDLVLSSPVDRVQDLGEYVSKSLPNTPQSKPTLHTVTSGGNTWINVFSCWEGCYDEYFTKVNDSIVELSFRCVPNCDTKKEADLSKYAGDRDAFLKSIQAK